MSEITIKVKCQRCGRYFKPKKDGDRYGPKCARIEAASLAALGRYGKDEHSVIV